VRCHTDNPLTSSTTWRRSINARALTASPKTGNECLTTMPIEDRNAKATKADDAAIPEYLWDRELTPSLNPVVITSLQCLRRFALRWWKASLEREFFIWFERTYTNEAVSDYVYNTSRSNNNADAARDWKAGMDCLRRSRRSEWWEWSDGSRPYFWRWPREYQEIIRDGLPIWELDALPKWFVPQRVAKILYMHLAM
jgi:hypothetical protein